jgi:predicted MFS family arabinose efflux permease
MRAANKATKLPKAIRYLFLARLINSAGSFVMPFMTMLLTVKLGWASGRAGTFMTLMYLAGAAGMLVGGKLGDSIGRKRLIVAGQAGAASLFLACFAAGLSPALPILAALANALLSSTWPVFNALVADIAPPEQRKRAYSLLYWGNNIGFSLGPLAAGFLFNRAVGLMFLVNAFALAVVASVISAFVRAPGAGGPGTPAPGSAAELAEGGGALAVLMRRPALAGFALVLALLNFVYAQHQFSLPIFLESRLGSGGPAAFGAAMTANGLTVVACTPLLALASGRLPALACLACAGALYAAGFGMYALLPQGSGLGIVLAATFVWTLGEILSATNVNVFIASRSPASHRSRLNSLMSIVGQAGSMLCPLASGRFIQARGVAAIWPLASCLAALGAALMLALLASERAAGPRPPVAKG